MADLEYHVVRGCLPLSTDVNDCGRFDNELLITVAQPSYDQSEFVHHYKYDLVKPDIRMFYAAFVVVFIAIGFLVSTSVIALTKVLITRPIAAL